MEDLDRFRERARAWLAEHMPRLPVGQQDAHGRTGEEIWARTRELQRILYDGGFAGICYPAEYGGQGLSPAHQRVFNEEAAGYEMPVHLNIPTLAICAPTILDFGTEEQKRAHLPAVLRGDEVLVQFLSEPRGGSDLAGVITRADRRGDHWVLNGSKIWSSGAYAADYGLCLTRTDWDAPKHEGLTMFLVKVHQPGVEIQRIHQVDEDPTFEFCQEFFDDVPLTDDDVLGEVNDGWRVATRLLNHERSAVGDGSMYASGPTRVQQRGQEQVSLVALAKAGGLLEDPGIREGIAETHVLGTVQGQLVTRVNAGLAAGALPDPAVSLLRLFGAKRNERQIQLGMEIAGLRSVAWRAEEDVLGGAFGRKFLSRQGSSLGGGSVEMARNLISERFLGMPREQLPDRGVPFREVPQGRA